MRRPRQAEPASNGQATGGILACVPTAERLEQALTGLELEAQRVRTLLAAVRQMSGSRQPLPLGQAECLPELAEIDETA